MKQHFTITIFVIGVLFLSSLSSGQKVDWSDLTDLGSDVEKVQVLGKNNRGYFLMVDNKEDYILQYNDRLRKQKKQPIELGQRRKSNLLRTFLTFNGVLTFYTYLNQDRELSLDALHYSFTGNHPVSESTLFSPSTADKRSYQVSQSQNYKRLLGIRVQQPTPKSYSLHLKALDYQLQPNWEKHLKVELSSKKADFIDHGITNTGVAYFVFSHPAPDQSTYRVYIYHPTKDSTFQFTIGPPDTETWDLISKPDNMNQAIVFGGLYREKKPQDMKGTFYSRVDLNDLQVVSDTTQTYPEKFRSQLLSKQIESQDMKESDFLLQAMILRSDGGCLLVTESYLTTKVSYTSPNFYSTYTRYENTYFHYNDLIVASVSPEGEKEWQQLIKKRQVAETPDNIYSSFQTVALRDHLFVIFNDNLSKSSNVMQYRITPSGEQKRSSLFKDLVAARWGRQVANNEFLFPGVDRKNFQLVRLTY